jgi:two-component system, cell cycle response regulator DivK
VSKRILVIEDQEDNRQILRDLLTSADFEVIEAADGEAGLAAAAVHRPDLILMDIQLPMLDGYEVTRRIKADPALRAIPIIAVTSYALRGCGQGPCRGLRRLHFQALQPTSASGEGARALVPARADEVIERDLCSQVHEVRNGSIASFLPCLPFVRSSSQTGHGS